ncbi:diguanylate cyclase [Pseudomarimonas salicorniae]|uniref:diguanylate cyclase n=1 Tax=Pseudomarimonas salicorniae TaxID=2933270 RepID=A0ABT0GEU5_9GAMM|nr:diguanylate cyclase [Lysobacter sp. CAU 1642]MCK7593074.1 GGDEF domain-containing protein [Lysobacter sp. CAU 1642]
MSDSRFSASAGNLLAVAHPSTTTQGLLDALEEEHRVVRVASIDAAAEALHRESPDLVLLDAALLADAAALLATLPRLHVQHLPLMLIGDAAHELVEQSVEAGVADWMPADLPAPLARRRVAIALDLRYAQELLRAQTLLDGLTGLANRKRFDEFLQAADGNARRRKEPMALILFDVDEFASYNEALGSRAGDEVLLHIGRTLASARRRPFDLFARFSGDCFACVLPDTDLEGARAVAELFLADVDALQIDHPDSQVASHVTISVGIAAHVPQPAEHPLILLEMANQALRRAKLAGRHVVSD